VHNGGLQLVGPAPRGSEEDAPASDAPAEESAE
jgi:hypothetical protein